MKRLKRLWFQNTGTVPSAVDLGELDELLKDQRQKKKKEKKLGLVFTIKTPNPHGE